MTEYSLMSRFEASVEANKVLSACACVGVGVSLMDSGPGVSLCCR